MDSFTTHGLVQICSTMHMALHVSEYMYSMSYPFLDSIYVTLTLTWTPRPLSLGPHSLFIYSLRHISNVFFLLCTRTKETVQNVKMWKGRHFLKSNFFPKIETWHYLWDILIRKTWSYRWDGGSIIYLFSYLVWKSLDNCVFNLNVKKNCVYMKSSNIALSSPLARVLQIDWKKGSFGA